MRALSKHDRWTIGGGTAVLIVIAVPLWREFSERHNAAWNVFLALLMTSIGIGALFLQHYFREHAGEIGDARFDTRNGSHDG